VNPTSATGGLDTFEGERPRLTGLAYRITCSLADAEDVVQEAWIRWAARDAATVDNPAGWLTTVTSRLALDRLRAQRRRREVYVGPWLPDPVPTAGNAEETAELAESLTLGFLVLLDSLGPYERVAFLLGDVFGEPYPAIAEILGKPSLRAGSSSRAPGESCTRPGRAPGLPLRRPPRPRCSSS
jgi:RNA polymerase sigma-70 factor, ECF subfamily